jgi:hypothetical protein
MAFIYVNDFPNKMIQWNEVITRLREQEGATRKEEKYLEGERIAHRNESVHLEKERLASESTILKLEGERLALDSSTLRMEGEREALESSIHHSEQERSRFEHEKQELEGERLALKEEREWWEKARDEQNIPKGAFWEVTLPIWECLAYGQREYWGILRNIPPGRSEVDACMNMPVEIRGVTIRRPSRCQWVDHSMHGFWVVDWDQPDCKPLHQDFNDWVGLRQLR